MSIRLNRAGRKAVIKRVLMQHRKRGNITSMTVGEIARRMGMKSSTALKNIIKEMIEIDDEIMQDATWDVFKVIYIPFSQMPLPDRYITINCKMHKVANWVLDVRETENVR